MSISYAYEVSSLKGDRQGELEKAVTHVFYECIGTSSTGRVMRQGGVHVCAPASSGSFTAWESLTEEAVLAWLSSEEKAQIEAELAAKINTADDADRVSGTPW